MRPRADLADLRRLLVNPDLDVAPVHRHGGSETTDAATDDGNAWLPRHWQEVLFLSALCQ